MRSLFFGLLLSFSVLHLVGQSNSSQALNWFQYKGKWDFTPASGLTLDLQHRRQDPISFTSQHVFRPGFTMHLKNDLDLTIGPALFWHSLDEEASAFRFELRPYVFMEWKQPLGNVKINHRSRFELRYNRKTAGLETLGGYNFNYRAGHRMGISIPLRLLQSNDNSLEIYDEVLINFGKRISTNHLDQNRMFIGLKRKLNGKLSLKLGYMYIFLPTTDPETTATQHIVVLGLASSRRVKD